MTSHANGSATPATIAQKYLARGWRPIPIPPKSKAPTIDDWQQLRLEEAEIPSRFRNGANIGVLNGEPSGWLVDVDLDHPLARKLADHYLPATGAEFGRKSSRRSHRLYVVAGAVETLHKRLPKVDGKAPMIVELRSTGSQTVFPGSIHPTDEKIEWDADGKPAEVPAGLLVAAVTALADAVEKELGAERKPRNDGSRNGHAGPPPNNVVERARKYVTKMPPAVSGQGGHDATFHVACVLVQGFALDRGPAIELLAEWNQTCQPPWEERDLAHKIDDALKANGERGYLLNDHPPSGGRQDHDHHGESVDSVDVDTHTTAAPTPFPIHTLPPTVGAFVGAAATAIGCDPSFIALPTLACLARAIGNKRVIRLKRTWTEPAIVWAAIIGKSGTHKTPSLQAAMQFLQKREAESFANHAEAVSNHEQDLAAYDRDLAAWRKQRNSTEPAPWKPEAPACERYLTSDTTIEALAALLAQQFDGVLVTRDELAGWFGGIAEYKGGKGSDLGHWLASWSGAPLTVDRKTGAVKTLHVPRAAVSLVGGIQQAVLRSAIGLEHMQDGLCARLLLTMPEPKPVRWSDAIIDPATEAALGVVFDRLLALEPAADAEGRPEPFPLDLSPEAKAAWIEYFDRHRAELAELDDDLAAAWSKLEAYAARIALIFQLCAWASGDAGGDIIDEASMAAAIELSDWFGGEAKRVYGLFCESDVDRDRRELVELIRRRGGTVTARELQQSSRRFKTSAEADAALDALVRAGIGRWEMVKTTRRPRRDFVLSTPSTSTVSPETGDLRNSVDVDNVDESPHAAGGEVQA